MEKNKKNKKDNKRQMSKVVSNLNTTSKKRSGISSVDVNTKSKIAKWSIAGSILAIAAVGISVPWALSSCVAQASLPFNDGDIMYYYIDPVTGDKKDVTFKEFNERINESYSSSEKEYLKLSKIFEQSVIKKYYDEERKAYYQFKAIIEATKFNSENKKVEPTTFGYDVTKSFDDVKKEQQNIFNQNKKSFQKVGRDWVDKWLKELQTNSIYGPQVFEGATVATLPTIEANAIEYMTTQAIKKPALARFETPEINVEQWSKKDLDTFKDPITGINYKDVDGVTRPANPNFFLGFLQEGKSAVTVNSILGQTAKNTLAVFQTKSYLPEHRNAVKHFTEIMPKYFNSVNVSSISLGIKLGETNASPMVISDKNLLTSLFRVKTDNKLPNTTGIDQFTAITQLSNFKGASIASSEDQKSQQRDMQLISALHTSTETPATDVAKKLGSSQAKTLNTIFASGSTDQQDSSTGTLNKDFALAALGLNGSKFTANTTDPDKLKQTDYELFKPKKQNPFNHFLSAFLSLGTTDNFNINAYPNFKFTDNSLTGTLPVDDTYFLKNWKAAGVSNLTQPVYALAKHINDNFVFKLDNSPSTTQPLTFKFKTGKSESKFNDDLKNLVEKLQDSDVAYIGSLLLASMTDENKQVVNESKVGVWKTYELNTNTFMYVGSEDIKIFSVDIINDNNFNDLQEMIRSDLYNSINVAPSTSKEGEESASSPVLLYNTPELFKNINNNEIIMDILLNAPAEVGEESNKVIFKQELVNLGIADAGNVVTQFEGLIKATITSNYTETIKTALDGEESTLKALIDSSKFYNFKSNPGTATQDQTVDWMDIDATDPIAKGFEQILMTYMQRIINILNSPMGGAA